MSQYKSPAAGGTADTGSGKTTTGHTDGSATLPPTQPRKWARVLRAFVEGRTFNRFDAYRELRDSCLNTTVSQIEARGVKILRREETVPGAFGPVHCCRYWIAPEALQRARELLWLPTSTTSQPMRENALDAVQAA